MLKPETEVSPFLIGGHKKVELKGVLHPLLNISMFYGLSKNYQLFLKNNVGIKLSKELKNGIEILVGQAVF